MNFSSKCRTYFLIPSFRAHYTNMYSQVYVSGVWIMLWLFFVIGIDSWETFHHCISLHFRSYVPKPILLWLLKSPTLGLNAALGLCRVVKSPLLEISPVFKDNIFLVWIDTWKSQACLYSVRELHREETLTGERSVLLLLRALCGGGRVWCEGVSQWEQVSRESSAVGCCPVSITSSKPSGLDSIQSTGRGHEAASHSLIFLRVRRLCRCKSCVMFGLRNNISWCSEDMLFSGWDWFVRDFMARKLGCSYLESGKMEQKGLLLLG